MAARHQPPDRKSQHRKLIGVLLGVVVIGGIASFVLRGGKQDEAKEEIVIVDLSPPPPPPPPPPPMEPQPDLSEPEEMDESEDIAEADAPDDMAEDSGDDIDLGLDAGDLASGPGSGSFVVSVPRIGGRRGGGGGGDGGGMMDDVDAPPTPVSKIQPNYPSGLLSKGVGGKVLIACVVDESGKVVSSSIKQSAHTELDKAALAAVAKWKFKPAQKAGRNVRASCVVPFNFEVKKS
jgi:protein TonB